MPIRRIPRVFYAILSIAPLIACLLAMPIAVYAECPTTTLTLFALDPGGILWHESQESLDPSGSLIRGTMVASYDLVTGTLTAVTPPAGGCSPEVSFVSRVTASDRFEIHNVAEATFTIRLNTSYTVDGADYVDYGAFDFLLESEGQLAETSAMIQQVPGSIEIEITAFEGVPFVITYETTARGYSVSTPRCFSYHCSTGAQLEFLGLPPGAEITSCNGYGAPEVPVEETTWGEMKALYR